MHFTTTTTTALLLTALTATSTNAAPAAKSAGKFHIHNFKSQCAAKPSSANNNVTFSIALRDYPSATCTIPCSATSNVLCGTISPEQAYYAYYPANSAGGPRALYVEFREEIPGGQASGVYGSKVVKKPTGSFDVAAYYPTTPA